MIKILLKKFLNSILWKFWLLHDRISQIFLTFRPNLGYFDASSQLLTFERKTIKNISPKDEKLTIFGPKTSFDEVCKNGKVRIASDLQRAGRQQ